MRDAWDPSQYERFKAERRRPLVDLIGLVRPRAGMRIVDLGCGTGEGTRLLHDRLGATETVGVDRSDAMLAKAAAFVGGGVRFEKGDLTAWRGAVALVFSNAALHWAEDHVKVLRGWTASLGAGGQLAVQVPANEDHVSHTIATDVARQEPFRTALAGYERRSSVLGPEAYAALLYELGYHEQRVDLRVYGHVLASAAEVVEWTRGTLLTDYEARLEPDVFASFVESYRTRLLAALPGARPYFYTYKRILFWGERAG